MPAKIKKWKDVKIFMNFSLILNWWMDPWNFLSGVMSVIALAGTFMNAERNKWGFAFWLISNLYMCIRFFMIHEYAQSVLFFVYFVLAIRGIYAWSRKENKDSTDEICENSKVVK